MVKTKGQKKDEILIVSLAGVGRISYDDGEFEQGSESRFSAESVDSAKMVTTHDRSDGLWMVFQVRGIPVQ